MKKQITELLIQYPTAAVPTKRNESSEAQPSRRNAIGRIQDQPSKLIEICTTMIHDPVSWGYLPNALHKTADQLWEKLYEARSVNANL